MPSNSSKYTEEFREQTAKMVIETGQSATSTAEEMGIDTNTVCKWVRDYRRRHGLPSYAEEKGLIFHSDRGAQYASKGYQELLEKNGITGSMSRPCCPYDNSCVESFFASLKKEKIYRKKYDTMEEIKTDIFRYIEIFYNRKRRHSTLEYMTPVGYLRKYDKKEAA